jgi:hypothetical protein
VDRIPLRYLLITQILLLSSLAFAADKPASCELAGKSVVSHSPSRLAQVSNVGLIEITCVVHVQHVPAGTAGSRSLLRVATVAYQVLPDGSKKPVPSETNQTGGGSDTETQLVYFTFHIPLEPAEREAEANRIAAWVEKSMAPQQITEETHQRTLERIRTIIGQHRVGHFQVECHMLDGDHLVGVAVIELEVLFKGRLSDLSLRGFSPA